MLQFPHRLFLAFAVLVAVHGPAAAAPPPPPPEYLRIGAVTARSETEADVLVGYRCRGERRIEVAVGDATGWYSTGSAAADCTTFATRYITVRASFDPDPWSVCPIGMRCAPDFERGERVRVTARLVEGLLDVVDEDADTLTLR